MTNTNKSNKDGQSASKPGRPSFPVLGKDVAYPESYRSLPQPAQKAFKEGFMAFCRGALLNSCPYSLKNLTKATSEHSRVSPLAKKGMPLIGAWQQGWRLAKNLNDSGQFIKKQLKSNRPPSLTIRLRSDQEELLLKYATIEVRSLNTMALEMIKWFFKQVSVNGVVTRPPKPSDKSDADKIMSGLQLRPPEQLRALILDAAGEAREQFPHVNAYIIAIVDEYIRAHPINSLE